VRTDLSELFYFELSPEKNILSLHRQNSNDSGLWVDFVSEWGAYRKQRVSGTDLLARATGVRRGMKICDLTLGLAGDALKLVYLGAEVTGVEQQPWIFQLVENALERVKDLEAGRKLKIRLGSSLELIDELLKDHDVFYLDPMFNHKRSALPKKGMQYLAEIAEEADEEALAVMMKKIIVAKKRLVVKRALKAPLLGELKPSRQILGKIVRFDVYN
jgi:16S rRNA (guanine1516-N2)-methyltransferase